MRSGVQLHWVVRTRAGGNGSAKPIGDPMDSTIDFLIEDYGVRVNAWSVILLTKSSALTHLGMIVLPWSSPMTQPHSREDNSRVCLVQSGPGKADPNTTFSRHMLCLNRDVR